MRFFPITLAFALFCSCAGSIPVSAQAAPPSGDMQGVPTTPPPTADAPAKPDGAASPRRDRQSAVRALVESCRQQERGSGLKGDARRTHLLSCVRAKDPRTATAMACKDKGRAQNLTDDALKRFVKQCRR